MNKPTKLIHLKNIHKDQKCIILGGGHSLKQLINFPYNELKNYTIIGANLAYKIHKLDYLIFLDRWLWNVFHKEIKEIKDTIKLTSITFEYKNLKIQLSKGIINIPTKGTYYKKFKCNNTGSAALSIVDYMGFNEIYLFGFDMNINDDVKNFHDCYKEKEKNRKTSLNRINDHYENIKYIIKDLEKKKVKIYSCSSCSKLNNDIEYVNPYCLV